MTTTEKPLVEYLLNISGWGVVWRGAAPLQLPLFPAFLRRYLVDLVRDLPPDLEAQIRDYVEFLLEKRRKAEVAELEQRAVERGWPPGYFEGTAGSLPDFPDIDGDLSGTAPALDRTDADLRFDSIEEHKPK